MTVKPTIIAPKALSPAGRTTGRSTGLALLMGAAWVLVAVAVNAAGEVALGMSFAVIAVLWVWIAAVAHQDGRTPRTTRTLRGQLRWQPAPSAA